MAYHIGNVVPGIDFTNDPLLQGRLFSYTDTQLIRLGGPNFHEIPINRPIVPIHNNQRDGFMRQQINRGRTSYHPNSLGGGCPFQAMMKEGGFSSFAEKIDAPKVRARSRSFFDHFSQAKLFFNSQSDFEQQHIVDALSFELGKVETLAIRERMLGILAQVDTGLASQIAYNIGVHIPQPPEQPMNHSIPADANPADHQPIFKEASFDISPALSMAGTIKDSIRTRKIAVLIADGVDDESLTIVTEALVSEGAVVELIAPRLGTIMSEANNEIHVDKSLLITASVFYDAVYVPGGTNSVATLEADQDAVHFLNEAYRHCKAIAVHADARQVLQSTYFGRKMPLTGNVDKLLDLSDGVILGSNNPEIAKRFIDAIAHHRFWEREPSRKVPA